MRKLVFYIFGSLFLQAFALAETLVPVGPPAGTSTSPAQIKNKLGPGDWDDRVFNVQPEAPPEKRSKSVSGTERYMADAPEYNAGQKRQWLETCSPFKDKGGKAYSDCYSGERKKAAAEQEKRFDRKEQEE